MQAVGAKEGLTMMENSDPLFLLIGLVSFYTFNQSVKKVIIDLYLFQPTVPVVLVLGRLVRWEEALLGFLNRNVPRMPIVKHFLPSFHIASVGSTRQMQQAQSSEVPPFSDPISATR